MLSRRNRLRTAEDFRIVLRRGKKRPVPGGLVAVLRKEGQSAVRFGFVCPKSVGSAVVRNTVKRRLRAAALSVLHDCPPSDVVVRAQRGSADVAVAQWARELAVALHAEKTR